MRDAAVSSRSLLRPGARPRQNDHKGAVAAIHDWFYAHVGDEATLHAIGHRVVHGGLESSTSQCGVEEGVLQVLEICSPNLIPLAPLHLPHAIAAIRAVSALAPNVPQIACFDTAFHRNGKSPLAHFALPRDLTAKGIRRYGFHGLSYEYIVSVLPQRCA